MSDLVSADHPTAADVDALAERVRELRAEFLKVDQEIDQARLQFTEFGMRTNDVFYSEMKERRTTLGISLNEAEDALRTAARQHKKFRRQAHIDQMLASSETKAIARQKHLEELEKAEQRKAIIVEEERRLRAERSRNKIAERHISRYFMAVAYAELSATEVERLRDMAEQRRADALRELDESQHPESG